MIVHQSINKLTQNIGQVIIGKEEAIELILVGLLANGHILIEDVPGVGKTILARALAQSLTCQFKRIQFTPDLTPSDVTGFFVYDRNSNEFVFRQGPVITNILLADEINRTVPRTQSSLLEAMEERQITVDGQTIALPQPFLVLATQNPVEQEGTFILPEAQLDRFLLKIKMGYPNISEEERILETHGGLNPLASLRPVIAIKELLEWQAECRKIQIDTSIRRYIVEIVARTRAHAAILLGASPRASLALYRSAQALALVRGRDYVIPDDVKYLIEPVIAHRLLIKREERLRGINAASILQEIVHATPVSVEELQDDAAE